MISHGTTPICPKIAAPASQFKTHVAGAFIIILNYLALAGFGRKAQEVDTSIGLFPLLLVDTQRVVAWLTSQPFPPF